MATQINKESPTKFNLNVLAIHFLSVCLFGWLVGLFVCLCITSIITEFLPLFIKQLQINLLGEQLYDYQPPK